ncbi:MAG: hypothetical protein U5L45_17920 [Saprospiraceae bacterium]|nr:hypothetical protein [Saprospiraceae bacterium]
MVHFSGFARKMNHIPLSRERSERENQQLRFYVWFQNKDECFGGNTQEKCVFLMI